MRYTKAGIQFGKSNAIKKAIIQLAEGESIDLYANA
jgi:large subunit ribosomal protein L23